MNYPEIQIGDKKTYTDWGVYLKRIVMPSMPKPKTNYIEIPGADGRLDITEVQTGHVLFDNRNCKIVLSVLDKDRSRWDALYSQIANYVHGQNRRLITTDNGYYYQGRFEMQEPSYSDLGDRMHITINAVLEPFKYELFASNEEWEWDSFSFIDGIIREYMNIPVNGEYTLVIPSRGQPVQPIFKIVTDTSMDLTFKGNTTTYTSGTYTSVSLYLDEDVNYMTFTGVGTVSVLYRGKSL